MIYIDVEWLPTSYVKPGEIQKLATSFYKTWGPNRQKKVAAYSPEIKEQMNQFGVWAELWSAEIVKS